jgi:hypothetical protein
MSKLAVCFTTLCMLATPALAESQSTRTPSAQVETGPAKTPASSAQLDQYAQREQLAEKLEKFEGGRGRGVETGTLIVILLLVIIILIVL